MSELTDRDLNEAIAKRLGWTEWIYWTEDLNPIVHHLIPVIEKHNLWEAFFAHTPSVARVGSYHYSKYPIGFRNAFLVTPRQLCEAWLKATEGVEL